MCSYKVLLCSSTGKRDKMKCMKDNNKQHNHLDLQMYLDINKKELTQYLKEC